MSQKNITVKRESNGVHGVKSTGNVFADLGIRDPDLARLKADVAIAIKAAIERKGITQREAGELMGLPAQKVSDIVCGRLKGYTLDRLFTYLNCLDVDVRIKMTVKPVKRQRAELRAV